MTLDMGTDTTKSSLLLVEDERPLLTLLHRYLERLGYTVYTAETGELALTQMRLHAPDAVVLDLGLPDMAGSEVLTRILDGNAQTRVLVSSGTPYSTELLPEEQRSRVGFLQKPYMPKALLDSVQELLEGGTPSDLG